MCNRSYGSAVLISMASYQGESCKTGMHSCDQSTILTAGQFIGEFSLMLGVPRTVTVKAVQDTTVFSISPQGFKQILQSQPQLYDRIVKEMSRHEIELTQQKRRLRELGLITSEYDKNPVAWVQKQLEKLFSLQG
jgi:potassium efflux system protein